MNWTPIQTHKWPSLSFNTWSGSLQSSLWYHPPGDIHTHTNKSDPSVPETQDLQNCDIENLRLSSWAGPNVKVISWVQHPIDSYPFCSILLGPQLGITRNNFINHLHKLFDNILIIKWIWMVLGKCTIMYTDGQSDGQTARETYATQDETSIPPSTSFERKV